MALQPKYNYSDKRLFPQLTLAKGSLPKLLLLKALSPTNNTLARDSLPSETWRETFAWHHIFVVLLLFMLKL